MSEPCSLSVRVHLSETAVQRFLAATPTVAADYADWRPWLEQAQMWGDGISDDDIAQMPRPDVDCNAELLERNGTYAKSDYDAETECWMFGVVEETENYGELLFVLGWLRAVAKFKDKPANHDAIYVWPYFWGGDDMACIAIEQGTSRFVLDDQAKHAIHVAACEHMDQLSADVAALYDS